MPFGSENNKKVLPSSNPNKISYHDSDLWFADILPTKTENTVRNPSERWFLLEISNFVKIRHLFCFTRSVFPFPHTSIHPSEAPAPRCAQGETSQGCTHGHRRDDVGLQVAYIVVITTHCCIEKTRGASTSPEIDHPHFFSGVQAGQFPDFKTKSDGLETALQLQVFCNMFFAAPIVSVGSWPLVCCILFEQITPKNCHTTQNL